jgi:thiamine-phosphate pyrophosphorylase
MNPSKNTAEHVENRVFRVLDANLNRATEAFRVLEEVARFGRDNSFLTGELKSARHELSLAFRSLANDLIDQRDTLSDIGTRLSTNSEMRRESISDLANANFARLQQALRSLEEFGKIISSDLAATVEQLRYRSYMLEKSLHITSRSRQDLSHHQLYALIGGGSSLDQFRDRVRQLVKAGVHVIQLRDKTLNDRELLKRAELLTEITRSTEVLSVINDRVDVAVASGADGVHLGQDELPVAAARKLASRRLLVGVSTHTIEQARQAVLEGADYLGVGPTFPSQTKTFEDFPGVELVALVASEISLPAFAIGGITTANVSEVIAAGLTRIAVQESLHDVDSLSATADEFLNQLDPKRETTAAVTGTKP